MPLRLDNAKSVAHMPTAEQQQTKKDFKPRFKVDHAASPMPETRQPERLAPRARSNRYTRARSSESAQTSVFLHSLDPIRTLARRLLLELHLHNCEAFVRKR